MSRYFLFHDLNKNHCEEEMEIAVVDSRSAAHHRNKTKLAFDMSRTYFFDVETEKIVSNYLCSPLLSIFSPSQY